MCEQKGKAGAGKWASLVLPRCVTAVLQANHVEVLATVLHACLRRLRQPCHRFQVPTDPRTTMKALAFSRSGALRMMNFAFEIRRESNPRGSKPQSYTVCDLNHSTNRVYKIGAERSHHM